MSNPMDELNLAAAAAVEQINNARNEALSSLQLSMEEVGNQTLNSIDQAHQASIQLINTTRDEALKSLQVSMTELRSQVLEALVQAQEARDTAVQASKTALENSVATQVSADAAAVSAANAAAAAVPRRGPFDGILNTVVFFLSATACLFVLKKNDIGIPIHVKPIEIKRIHVDPGLRFVLCKIPMRPKVRVALGIFAGLLASHILRGLYFGRFTSSLGVFSTLVLLILVGRAAFVFPLSVLSNYMNRTTTSSSTKITFQHQVVIWWAGLMRGAVSIALAFKQFTFYGVTLDPLNAALVTTTIVVVLFSTIVFGFLTKPLVSYLLPPRSNIGDIDREPSITKDDMRLPLLSFEESTSTNLNRAKDSFAMLMERPVYTIHSYWRRFDDAYMRPVFGGPRSDPPS